MKRNGLAASLLVGARRPSGHGPAQSLAEAVKRALSVTGTPPAKPAPAAGAPNPRLDESPRVYFLHFWGVGAPDAIGRGVKQALAQTKSTGP